MKLTKSLILIAGTYVCYKAVKILLRHISDRVRYGNLPTPANEPLIGSGRLLAEKTEKGNFKTVSVFRKYHKLFQNEPVWVFWRGLTPMFMVRSPEALGVILTSQTFIRKDYDNVKTWIGDGLAFSSGKKWAQRRKLLTPAFRVDIIKSFEDQVHGHVLETVERVKQLSSSQGEFDFDQMIQEEVFKNLLETQMRLDEESIAAISPESRKAYFDSLTGLFMNEQAKFRNVLCNVPFIREFTPELKKQKQYKATFLKMAKLMVELKVRQRYREQAQKKVIKKIGILDLMLEAMEKNKGLMDIADIVEELNTFIFAGFDTSSSALTWLIYSLSNHQQVQSRLREEILANFQKGSKCTMDELNNLKYMDAVIKESLRLHPSAVGVLRKGDPFEIPLKNGNKLTIRAGAPVNLCIDAVHKDTNIWGPDAEEFDPDRFLDPNRDPRDKYPFCYIPFSAGPRNCIGQRYANLVVKYFLVHLILNFNFDTYVTDDTIVPVVIGTLQPEGGLRVNVSIL